MEIINRILKEKGHSKLVELLKDARFEIDVGSNYGSCLFSQLSTAEIFVPIDVHAKVVTMSEESKKVILDAFLAAFPIKEHAPEIVGINFNLDNFKDKNLSSKISLSIRKNLLDAIITMGEGSKNGISGKLSWLDFLNRIWPLNEIESEDYRFPSAYLDVKQHTVNNSDWDTYYILYNRFDLLHESDENFLLFIEQLVHPLVRSSDDQELYVSMVNKYIIECNYKLEIKEKLDDLFLFQIVKSKPGVNKVIKNIIFATTGPKPEIILSDSISNEIKVVKNEEFCLIYDRKIPETGLLWEELVDWYKNILKIENLKEVRQSLYIRLMKSITSEPEKILFKNYYNKFASLLENKLPALLPQVYLHYDPYSIKRLREGKNLYRQRMDFLLLLSDKHRVILEVDGIQHYSEEKQLSGCHYNIANPKKYADMLYEDRKLNLAGYEVYRFGGYELFEKLSAEKLIYEFFENLFSKHKVFL